MNDKFDFPLVDNDQFHDACGIGFVATRSGKPEGRILPLALKKLFIEALSLMIIIQEMEQEMIDIPSVKKLLKMRHAQA